MSVPQPILSTLAKAGSCTSMLACTTTLRWAWFLAGSWLSDPTDKRCTQASGPAAAGQPPAIQRRFPHGLYPRPCAPACSRSVTTSTWSRCEPTLHRGGSRAAPTCAAPPSTCRHPMVGAAAAISCHRRWLQCILSASGCAPSGAAPSMHRRTSAAPKAALPAAVGTSPPAGSEVQGGWQSLVPDEACPPFDFPKVNPLRRGKPYR